MTRHTVAGTLTLVFVFVAFGVLPDAARQAQEVTLTGCLQAGSNSGDFVLVLDDKETYQIQAAEGVDLAPHANHRVELTGVIEKTDASPVLKTTALKMIASSCEA